MDFANGFIEDDSPVILPGRTPPPPPPQPIRSSIPNTSTATTTDAVLDLTEDSPSPPPSAGGRPPQRPPPPPPRQKFGDGNSTASSTSLGGRAVAGNSAGVNGNEGTATRKAYGAGTGGGFGLYASKPSPSASPSSSLAGDSSARHLAGGAVHSHPLASLSSAPRSTFSLPAGPTALGRIPVISSASNARMPSQLIGGSAGLAGGGGGGGFMPGGREFYTQQPQPSASSSSRSIPKPATLSSSSPVHVSFSSAAPPLDTKPKPRAPPIHPPSSSNDIIDVSDAPTPPAEVLDLVNAPDESDDDPVFDETPVCIGMIAPSALITDPFYPVIPPPPPATHVCPGGRLLTPEELAAEEARFTAETIAYRRGSLPVHLHHEGHVFSASDGQYHQMLRLLVEVPGTKFGDVPPRAFGFMEYKVADTIAPLLGAGWHGTGITKGGNGKVYCEASLIRSGELNPCMLKLRLVLFARRPDIHVVSSALEAASPSPLFLLHPLPPPFPAPHGQRYGDYAYDNPHNPSDGVDAGGERRRAELARNLAQSGGGMGGMTLQSKQGRAVDVQKEQVQKIFAEIKSGTDLDEVEPPPIVRTPLYPHQKQALSFLLDRESPIAIPERDADPKDGIIVSLWQRQNDPYGRPIGWKSLVTDLMVKGGKAPPQARGAILADDMGLGKTIVVISLVCTTLPDARLWASQPCSHEKVDTRMDDSADGFSRNDFTSAGRAVGTSDFGSHIWGLGGANSTDGFGGASTSSSSMYGANGKPLSKKKQAEQRREKKKDELATLRYGRLACRSRATLIVCPLSTVQNWESQFEEHTKRVEKDEEGGTVYTFGGEEEEDDDEKPKPRKGGKGKGKAKVEDSEEDDAGSKMASAVTSAANSSVEDDNDSIDSYDSDAKPELKKRKPKPPKPALSIYIYHGNTRLSDPKKLADHDVVITTFSTLGTEYSKQQKVEEEREDEEERAAKRRQEEEDGLVEILEFRIDGKYGEEGGKGGEGDGKKKRKRKKPEGNGVSPLQAVQWYRVVLDEAHIIKEHKTIQARAACDLSTSRRIALTGTPLQNSLNDIFSLIRFIRLEPFTERHIWTQYIGGLAQKGEDLGTERLKLIMRHLALRRTKDTKDVNGKPILALPSFDVQIARLELNEKERAFYSAHHSRYKHDFAKLEETDSVMKNFCTILQELLKLRQICCHPALLQDTEDRAGGGGDLTELIEKHGISRPRAIQLISLLRDAEAGDCRSCGSSLAAFGKANVEELGMEDEGGTGKGGKKPAAKRRKVAPKTATAATSSGVKLDEDGTASESGGGADEMTSCVVTRCQHLFCRQCFQAYMAPSWPSVKSDEKSVCKECDIEFLPALDAVEVEAGEFQKALERAGDENLEEGGAKGRKAKKRKERARLFEHSTKTLRLIQDLEPFSRCNPESANFDPLYDPTTLKKEDGSDLTIGIQPVQGEVVKSVVFSQWTTLLDRLGDALEQQNIKYRRLDGSMKREERNAAMEAFKSEPPVEVLLVSLRAGGVGLNLTAGRRVYLMEPFWNPAVENQAIDRIYRLGQTKPVQCVRFVMEGTVESNMLKIQARKLELAKMSVGKTLSKAEMQRLRQEEVRILMS